ncbi:MAG: PepSY-associated TM helix domain-containing protein [Rhodospirillaceae bacterium]|nr:PepSY-associated TM helix domain-containing protein [Rhodospirillaceae bacterium]
MSATKAKPDWLIWIHRYVGLTVGLWLFFVGASGAILAYYRELDVAFNPDLFAVKDAPQHPDLDRMLETVQAAHPNRFVLYVERYGLERGEAHFFNLTRELPRTAAGLDLSSIGNYDDAYDWQVFVDPATNRIIGERSYWTTLNFLRDFHREFFAPPTGRDFLGALGLTLFVSAVIGVVLWWRDAKKHLKRALTFRASAAVPRLIRDGHTVLGFYAALIIGWLSLSATLICYGGELREFADWVLRGGKPAQNFESVVMEAEHKPVAVAERMYSLSRARDTALTDHPNSDVVLVRMPKTPAARYTFRLYPTDEDKTLYTRQVYIDAGTGEIVGRFDPKRQPWTDSLFGLWLIWFHNGTMLGDVGRAFNIFAGVVLASLFPTGLYIWWKKRRARVPKKAAAPAASSQTAVNPAE